MTSNLDYRLILTKNANLIIKNNQENTLGNCSNIEPIINTKTLTQNPYLISNIIDSSLPFENSDLKENYIKKYIMSASKFTPIVHIN